MAKPVPLFLCCALLLMISCAAAQPESARSLTQNLIAAYERFDYPEFDRLLEIALAEIETFPPQERRQIYQYAAFRRFQQGEILPAEEFFWKLLEIDPTYSLDPLTTPPKVLALFQQTKVRYLENLQQRLEQLEQSVSHNPVPWRSLVFPGWEQWRRGYRAKGALWAGAGVVCIAGIVQAVIRTGDAKEEYENALEAGEIRDRYQDYNRLYQSQFYWSYAFIGVWLSSHIDALFFSPLKSPRQISLNLHPTQPAVTLSIQF